MNSSDVLTISRREALTAALIAPLIFSATTRVQADSPVAPTEFVPENDYPYFGYEPEGEPLSAKLPFANVTTDQS